MESKVSALDRSEHGDQHEEDIDKDKERKIPTRLVDTNSPNEV